MLLILSHFFFYSDKIDQTNINIRFRYKLIQDWNQICLHLLDRRRHSRLSDQKYKKGENTIKTLNTVICTYKIQRFLYEALHVSKSVCFSCFKIIKNTRLRMFFFWFLDLILQSDMFWKTGSRLFIQKWKLFLLGFFGGWGGIFLPFPSREWRIGWTQKRHLLHLCVWFVAPLWFLLFLLDISRKIKCFRWSVVFFLFFNGF